MSLLGRSLLDIPQLKEPDVFQLFETARRIRHIHQTHKIDVSQLARSHAHKYVALIFFEPSTRTRSSFEVAAYKLGLQVLAPEFGPGSSRVKGETLVDTLLNIDAMDPDAIVLRSGAAPELDEVVRNFETPIINAGSGATAHPTQALLDAFTIHEELSGVRGRKVLIVGDIRHSRVAQSNIRLLQVLGANLAFCGPRSFLPVEHESLTTFEIEEGMAWADVVMALRVQLERHGGEEVFDRGDYHYKFGITEQRMRALGGGILMHPGPINQGVELSSDVLKDPRCRILKQVQNGVYMRAAVLAQVLGIEI